MPGSRALKEVMRTQKIGGAKEKINTPEGKQYPTEKKTDGAKPNYPQRPANSKEPMLKY